MTAAQTNSPRHRDRGCLWGCLAVLAFVFLPILLAAGYGGWFFYQGYRRDPVLRAVTELVRRDGLAEQALGRHIRLTGIEGSALTFVPGLGQSGSYVVSLAGAKGAGTLAVTAHIAHGRLKIERMILAGPDGTHYDLLHHLIQGPSGNPTTSI